MAATSSPAETSTLKTQDVEPDVFISYARADREAVTRLATGLEGAGWNVWVDTDDIPPTADWSDEIDVGIRTAHTFVFAISPRSVESEFCLRELTQAVNLGKRLVPVVIDDTSNVPPALAARQYIYFRESDHFDASLQTLTTALATDLEWVREHRQWLTAALRWEASGRDRSLLVRGRDLKNAEAWLARQAERTEPRPTSAQTEFLVASRSAQTRRLQTLVVGIAIALAVSIALGLLAWVQRNTARRQSEIARSRELAIASTSKLSVDPELSLLLAIEAVKTRRTAEADNALRSSVAADRLTDEVRLAGQDIRSLVTDVAVAADLKTIAVAMSDGTIQLATLRGRGGRVRQLPTPARSGSNLCTQFLHAQRDTRLALSADGSSLAASGDKSLIEVWRLSGPTRPPFIASFCLGRAAAPSPADVVAATFGSGVGAAGLALTEGGTVSAVEQNGRLLRWRWQTDKTAAAVKLTAKPVVAAVLAGPDHRTVVFAGRTHVSTWAAGRGLVATRDEPGVYALAAGGDGNRIAAAHGRAVAVWTTGVPRPARFSGPEVVRSVALSSDGNFLATGDEAGTIRVWDVSRAAPPSVLRGSGGPVTAVAFSRDGKRVVSSGDDGVLRVWKWQTAKPLLPPATAKLVGGVAITRDGRIVVQAASDRRKAFTLDGRHSRPLGVLGDPHNISFDRNGLRAAAPLGTLLELWNLASSPVPSVLRAGGHVDAAAVSPDGRWIASGESDRLRLLRWPGRDARVIDRARVGAGKFLDYNDVVFSPDSDRLAAAAYNGKTSDVRMWKLGGGPPRRVLETAVSSYVSTLAFSRDGTKLLAALGDGRIWVWNLDDGGTIVLRGEGGVVGSASFSPTGDEVVSGNGASLQLWELNENGKSVSFPAEVGAITGTVFAHDGTSIDVVGTKGAQVIPCGFCGSIDDVLARAKAMTTRTLTPDERELYLHR